MAEIDFYSVADAGTLRKLRSGLEIIRRQKHEWRKELDEVPLEKLRLLTGKKWGSKFLPVWNLNRLVGFIDEQVTLAGWEIGLDAGAALHVPMMEPVGLVDGLAVRTIRIVSDGRYVHAYPVKD